MNLTQELEASLRWMDAEATHGEWFYQAEPGYCAELNDERGGNICTFTDDPTATNGEFIAASRNAIPALLGEIDRLRAMTQWQPIDTAPKDTKTMFVVIAMRVDVGSIGCYDSDPWCVWSERGSFIRWPHKFPPTHWMPLPAAPKTEEV